MSDPATPRYRATLALSQTRTVLALGILTRLASGLIPFAVLISFTQRHGIGAAGLASGALMLAIALPGPARARWCARRGPWALIGMSAASAALFVIGAATLSLRMWAVPLTVITAAGALLPPLAPTLRAVWSRLMPDKQHLQSVHALDSTIEEVTFIVAPLLGTAGMSLTSPPWTLVAGAALLPLAALGLSRLLHALPAAEAETASGSNSAPGQGSLIRSTVGQGIVVPIITLGLCAGGLNVIIPQATAGFSGVTSSGYSFAAFSLGGLAGGLLYGRRTWKASLRLRYTASTLALGAGALVLAACATSPWVILAAFCVGLPMTPLFVIAYLLVDERIHTSRHAEANAWLGSGYNLGSAAGAALGGQLIDATGPRTTAVALAAVTALAALFSHRMPDESSQTTARDGTRDNASLEP